MRKRIKICVLSDPKLEFRSINDGEILYQFLIGDLPNFLLNAGICHFYEKSLEFSEPQFQYLVNIKNQAKEKPKPFDFGVNLSSS